MSHSCARFPAGRRERALPQVQHGLLRRLALLLAALLASTAPADGFGVQQSDAAWPGFRGPGADGAVVANTLAGADAMSLEIAWKRSIGSGYSGVSVSADLVVTMFVDGDDTDTMAAFDHGIG